MWPPYLVVAKTTFGFSRKASAPILSPMNGSSNAFMKRVGIFMLGIL
jgi:hypothetical protein